MVEKILKEIKGLEYDVNIIKDSGYVRIWADWYGGNVKDFHNYRWYNGKHTIDLKLKSLQMAKKVCEDWADLLLNEKCDIVIPDEASQDIFNNILDESNFWVKANEGVEHSFALGYGTLVMGIDGVLFGDKGSIDSSNGKITIDFVNRFNTTIITMKNKTITEIAFEIVNNDSKYYILHLIENEEYVIYTYKEVKGLHYFENRFPTGSKRPWFQMLRPFISSNLIFGDKEIEPFISVFANSLDTLRSIDTKYDSFDNEFIAGRKRLFASDEMFEVHNLKNGSQDKSFDPMSTTIHMLPASAGDSGQFLSDQSGMLRATDHILAIDTELNLLSSKSGLGESFYKFDGEGFATATQVVSENSKLFRTLKKHEININAALRGLTIAIIEASGNHTKDKINVSVDQYVDINIIFDDSIIEDKGTEMERDKGLVAIGILSKVEFREKWLGEDYDTALNKYRLYFKYDIMDQYMPALMQGAMTPTDFLIEVYGVADADKVEYITEKIKTQDYGGFIDELYNDTE